MTKFILSFATVLVLLAGAADTAWARAGASGHMAFRGYLGSANGCKVHPGRARCHQEASRQEQEDRQRAMSHPE
jgi:maltoporin